MAFPLLAIAASILPDIIRALAGDRAGSVAGSVADAVRTATGTEDPEAARQKLDADPAAAASLRLQLAQIALESERLRAGEEEQRRQAALEELRTRIGDTEQARGAMLGLVQADSAIGWGAPTVSAIVTMGFFVTLLVMVWGGPAPGEARELLNIIVGALVAAFTAVVNFWIGSSQGSREKDGIVRNLQAAQAEQAQAAIQGQSRQAQAAIQSLRQVASSAANATAAPVTLLGATPPSRKPGGFDRCVALILEKEGGYVDHPRDRGGPTNFGITLRTYAAFHEVPAESVTAEAIQALTPEEAKEIYRANYWTAARCEELPPGVDLMVFDFAVNAGLRASIRMLQELVHVTQDGSIGPITLAATRTCEAEDLIARFAERRLAYYRGLANFDVFGKGWTARTLSVRTEALRLAGAATA